MLFFFFAKITLIKESTTILNNNNELVGLSSCLFVLTLNESLHLYTHNLQKHWKRIDFLVFQSMNLMNFLVVVVAHLFYSFFFW